MKGVNGKKGSETEILINIFGIVIAAAVILVLIYAGGGIWKIFSNEQDQGTKESFLVLSGKLEKLSDGSQTEQLFYIKPDFFLYGFNKNSDKVTYNHGIGIFGTGTVKKPAKCGNGKACICICDKDDCTGNIKDCKQHDNINFYVVEKIERNQGIAVTFEDQNQKKVDANYLAVFGKTWGIGPISNEWKVRPIKIRREGDVIYFSE